MAVNLWMMPWVPRDFAASTRGWTFVARGIYRELLDAQWELGELPAHLDQLQRIVGCSDAEWAAGWPAVSGKFPCVRGKRKNARLEQHRIRSINLTKARSDAANKTNTKLYGNAERTAKRDAKRTHQDQEQYQDQDQEQKQPKTKIPDLAFPQDPTPSHVTGLDVKVWQRWFAYRAKSKKPIKAASIDAAMRKLAAFGEQQSQVVENSIAEGYQGLFAIKLNGNGSHKPYRQSKTADQLEAEEKQNADR